MKILLLHIFKQNSPCWEVQVLLKSWPNFHKVLCRELSTPFCAILSAQVPATAGTPRLPGSCWHLSLSSQWNMARLSAL